MAAPNITPAQMVSAIHQRTPGQSRQGWTISTRQVLDTTNYLGSVTDPDGAVWTFNYTEQRGRTAGKVRRVTNPAGEPYERNPAGSWVLAAWADTRGG